MMTAAASSILLVMNHAQTSTVFIVKTLNWCDYSKRRGHYPVRILVLNVLVLSFVFSVWTTIDRPILQPQVQSSGPIFLTNQISFVFHHGKVSTLLLDNLKNKADIKNL